MKKAKGALECVFGGGFVAQKEGAGFGLRIGRACQAGVVLALRADAEPFGFGGLADGFEENVAFGAAVVPAPMLEQEEKFVHGFARLDESLRAEAVFARILRRDGAAFGRDGAGAAGVAFLPNFGGHQAAFSSLGFLAGGFSSGFGSRGSTHTGGFSGQRPLGQSRMV